MTTPIEPEELRRRLDEVAAGPTTAVFDDVYRRAHRRRRSLRAALVASTVAVVAAAIALPVALVSSNGAPATVTSSPRPNLPTLPASPVPVVHTNPLLLIGRWKLTAAGEKPGTSLILGDQLSLFRPCGLLDGEWRADHDGLFIGYLGGGDGSCFRHGGRGISAPWLAEAVGYRIEGPDRVLVGAAGQIVARLAPGAHPTTGPNDATSYAAAPKITAALRTLLRTPAPLPTGLRPATLAEIAGRWWTIGPGTAKAYVQFNRAGSWSGSDGCNGGGGRLAIGEDGEILTLGAVSGLVGCLGSSQATYWVEVARRVGFDGSVLVLLDVNGKVLGRLSQQPPVRVTGTFVRAGGPPGTPNVPLSGSIAAHAGSAKGSIAAVTIATAGHFKMALTPGRYVFVGVDASIHSWRCSSGTPTTVAAGQTVHVSVVCNIR